MTEPNSVRLPDNFKADGNVLKPVIYASRALEELSGRDDGKVGLFLRERGLLGPFSEPYVANFENSEKILPICLLNSTHLLPLVGELQYRLGDYLNNDEFNFIIKPPIIKNFFNTLVTLGGSLTSTPTPNLLSRIEYANMDSTSHVSIFPI